MSQFCNLCHAAIPDGDLNMENGLAHCPNCHAVFNFTSASLMDKPDHQTMNAPECLTSTQDAGGLHLIYRWRKTRLSVPLLVVALVNMLVIWWLVDAFHQQRLEQAAVGLVFLVVGICAIGCLLRMLFNRTHIRITMNQLMVRQELLFPAGRRSMPREQIKQVYVVQSNYGKGKHMHMRYGVQAALYDYPDMVLVENLGDPHDALYIEQQVERYLNIRDVRVAGEFARGLF